MFCSSTSAVSNVDFDMDSRKLKEGDVLKYKTGFLGSKWKKFHLVLFSDSMLCWYDERGDRKPKGSILLKDVVPYICVGLMTDRMPTKRPQCPEGHSVHHLVGVGMDPRAETVHWFQFSSDSELESWIVEITKTLPKPNPPPGPPAGGSPQSQSGGYIPPPKYPDAPPPVQPAGGGGYRPSTGGSGPPPYAGGYPQQQYGGGGGYSPAPPQHTTVIVRDGGGGYGGYGGGYGGGSSLGGMGLGLGGGLLAGSLLGYGLGSMWGGHHSYFPSYGGFGGGYGMGGGYYSDNDTNVTNNYYNYGGGGEGAATHDATHTPGDANLDEIDDGRIEDAETGDDGTYGIGDLSVEDNAYGAAEEVPQDDGNDSFNQDNSGYDYGNANEGGDDYGVGGLDYGNAGDFGGGDFGGGDFGGGDFGGGDFGGGDYG
ncbi:unnamed protein product [Caenorhabditis auriculariae]|uniref:PH domain-containing protein n=1 Tax=Caenorhabditis auriculariae TaxID=2777116 RepID=A0A8S1HPP5_9PELO|nr:unnamed protein product [Caenorhabditis auriculariae]